MAIIITDECTNCGACPSECPNYAIYEEGEQWSYADGTQLKEIELENGTTMDATTKHDPISGGFQGANGHDFHYIVPTKCTECTDFHEEPACALVCPMDCCVPDPDYEETNAELSSKRIWIHGE